MQSGEEVSISVVLDGDDPERMTQLAERLGLPLTRNGISAESEIQIRYLHGCLQALCLGSDGRPHLVECDLMASSVQQRRARRGRDLLVKAVQGRQKEPLQILDATAGFCVDATILAAMGHRVVACEASPFVYELVKDGLVRARQQGLTLLPELYHQNVIEWLQANRSLTPDVIYIDPMFQPSGKKALPDKQMQLLRQVAHVGDFSSLLELCRRRALLRVVVKQPLKGGRTVVSPDYSIKGKRVRYDIYGRVEGNG